MAQSLSIETYFAFKNLRKRMFRMFECITRKSAECFELTGGVYPVAQGQLVTSSPSFDRKRNLCGPQENEQERSNAGIAPVVQHFVEANKPAHLFRSRFSVCLKSSP